MSILILSMSILIFCYNFFMRYFAIRLKELRKEKNLTQKQLAEAIEVTQSMITRWEKDECEPTATVIVKIADYFNVCTDYLLGRKDWY